MSDKIYLIIIRFLSIASFATSVFALFTSHHKITINEHPYVSHIFDIQCEDLPADSDAQKYCETSLMTRYYGLWRAFDNFFSLMDWDGGVLCGDREFPVPVHDNKDIAMMTVDNLGNCSDTTAMIATGLCILTCVCSTFLVIYITVFASMPDSTISGGILLILTLSFVGSSTGAMLIYILSIDPLRLEPTFCDKQTLFSTCEQDMGDGFWFQVVTVTMASMILVVSVFWKVFGCGADPPQQPQKQLDNNHHSHHPPFYASLHFYVMMVRFSELAILIFGLVSPFTIVQTTIPPRANVITSDGSVLGHAFAGEGGEMETSITLWQGLFCQPFGSRLFLWSVVLDEDGQLEGSSGSGSDSEAETFGQCEFSDLFESRFGYIMALMTAITAMTFQKDAKTMPLAYMVGFIMHFLSMLKLSIAIAKFMLDVFPGRKAIDPSYCSLWTSYVGDNATCSIKVGEGLILTAAALGSVAISFVGELVVQSSEEYGVAAAYRTLTGRVRQGRIRDLVKPAGESTRKLDVGGNDNENFTDEHQIVVYGSEQTEGEEEEIPPGGSKWVICVGVLIVVLVVMIVLTAMTVVVALVRHREEL